MSHLIRNKVAAVIAETAMALPIFLFLIFSLVEFTRAIYVQNTIGIAAQQVASDIAVNVKRTSSYNIASFSTYANKVRFPGSVIDSGQFSFDVTDASNNSTVANGQANSSTSTKVVVTVSFPPASKPAIKIPIVDPGNLIGRPIFGAAGLKLSSSATCFLERSRRPILN